MKIKIIHFTGTCRKCLQEFDLIAKVDVVPFDAELAVHEHLESEGWVDGYCPKCAELEYDNNSPENREDETNP